jgi:hypothetical protein
VGWKNNEAGERIPYRKTYTAATRHEVAAKLNDALRDLGQGSNIKPRKLTVEAFLRTWLEDVAKPSEARKPSAPIQTSLSSTSRQASGRFNSRNCHHSTSARFKTKS